MMIVNLARTFIHSPVTKKVEIYQFVAHTHYSVVFTTIYKVEITIFKIFSTLSTINHSFRVDVIPV